MPFTSADTAKQMIDQLRVLDPAISAEPGTPERKIIDTVAIKIAESQLDLTTLQGGLSIDNKFGANLDNFLSIFNFGRQQPVAAEGFVTFSRPNAPAPRDIRIPAGTRAIAPDPQGDIVFRTSFDVVLKQGTTSAIAPITAVIPGTLGNLAANRITQLVNVEGIYAVTNEAPTRGGLSREDDDLLKARFKNTVFRNVSGTYDQYLALAVSTPSTTKANVVGPISRYREYIQVPDADDATANGDAAEWSTSLSTIPYSKYTYDTVPHFVSNGRLGAEAIFYRGDADYLLNTEATKKNRGDAYRQKLANPGEAEWDALDGSNAQRPSITFLNVYSGTDEAVTAARPGDVLLFEHSYMSSASRNDWDRNVTNCVDVFVDGSSEVVASAVIPRPTSASMFVDDPTHRFHFKNYVRTGERQHNPVIGNLFTPLFFQPVIDLPEVLTVGGYNYYLGYHYWLVEDVSELGGTVRARSGIEWDKYLPGQQSGGTDDAPETWTGPTILWGDEGPETGVASSIEVDGYTYDRNINDLQATFDSSGKQTTTDALAHRAKRRYFKLDITVMYAPGANTAEANATIRAAVQDFFQGQYFGSAIQLSDLLNVIHNVIPVDNVRWSRDVPSVGSEIDTTRSRVVEANVGGSTLTDPVIDTTVWGASTRKQEARIYLPNTPTAGNFTLSYNGTTSTLAYNVSTGALQTALRTITGDVSLTVTGAGTPSSPWIVLFSAVGIKSLFLLTASTLSGGPTIFNTDFYLEDDELPALPEELQAGDTVPGLTIRPRAQSTWVRL